MNDNTRAAFEQAMVAITAVAAGVGVPCAIYGLATPLFTVGCFAVATAAATVGWNINRP